MADGWERAGRAWSEQAVDFAYLFEPFARPAYQAVFDQAGVDAGQRLCDVACGAGFAAMMAAERGAVVAGLDASDGLLGVARTRAPDGDFRVGDMDDLPFRDEQFDVVCSFSGILAGQDRAMTEAVRVLRPGGAFGMATWGSPRRRGHLAYFTALVDISPPQHIQDSLVSMATGRPGVAEALLAAAGLEVLERGRVDVTSEWPDVATSVRAAASAGPSWPAIHQVGRPRFDEVMTAAFSAVADERLGVRLTSEFFWITARKPV